MEPARTSGSYNHITCTTGNTPDDCVLTEQRLGRLLDLNRAIERDKKMFRTSRERYEAHLIRRPLPATTVFGLFGLIIGSLPPLAIAVKSISETVTLRPPHFILIALLVVSSIVTGIVGAVLGRRVPAAIDSARGLRIPNRLAALVLLGISWGAVSGIAGGVFLFLFGAFFGAIVGAVIGALTVPAMVTMYEILRRGEVMDSRHFAPIAIGLTLAVCAFIIGL